VSRGKFIVIDGPDGAGKSTLAARLVRRITEEHRPVTLTAEPTHGPLGRIIRDYLRGATDVAHDAIPLLFSADRADHYQRGIAPLLAKAQHVVCDRYVWSNVAYGAAQVDGPFYRCLCSWWGEPSGVIVAPDPDSDGTNGPESTYNCPRCRTFLSFSSQVLDRMGWMRGLDKHAAIPDLTIILSVRPEVGRERLKSRGAPAERYENDRMQERVCAVYDRAREYARSESQTMVVVDANGSEDETWERVWIAVVARLLLG
jgi:dTMP kinase